MEKILYPTHPVRCTITGPSECGKSFFLTNLISNIINEHDKIYVYSPSLHQDIYQKLIKCFSNYIPIHIIPNILNEEDIDVVIEEIVDIKDFEKSDTEIETNESIKDLNLFYKNYVGEELMQPYITFPDTKYFYPIQITDLRHQADHLTPKKIQIFEDFSEDPANERLFLILIRHRQVEMISDGIKFIEVEII